MIMLPLMVKKKEKRRIRIHICTEFPNEYRQTKLKKCVDMVRKIGISAHL